MLLYEGRCPADRGCHIVKISACVCVTHCVCGEPGHGQYIWAWLWHLVPVWINVGGACCHGLAEQQGPDQDAQLSHLEYSIVL